MLNSKINDAKQVEDESFMEFSPLAKNSLEPTEQQYGS
jgi:hypothetical protein